MRQQFVIIHQYTILQETAKNLLISSRRTLKRVMFLPKCKDQHFFVDTTF